MVEILRCKQGTGTTGDEADEISKMWSQTLAMALNRLKADHHD